MSALWLVPVLLGVVAICVVGVLDTLVHMTVERIRTEADLLAEVAATAESLVPPGELAGGRPGSGTRPGRN